MIKTLALIACSVVCMAQSAPPEKPPKWMDHYVAALRDEIAANAAAIVKAENELASMRTGIIVVKKDEPAVQEKKNRKGEWQYVFNGKRAKEFAIEEQIKTIQRLKDQKLEREQGHLLDADESLDPTTLKVGQVGEWKTAYTVIRYHRRWVGGQQSTEQIPVQETLVFKVVQVLDTHDALISGRDRTFWLAGVPTDEWVDDATIRLPGLYSVTETTSYETSGGDSNTVFLIERIDVRKYLPEIVKRISG